MNHGVVSKGALCPNTVSDCRVPQMYPARGHKLERGLRAIDRLCEQADDKADAAPCGRLRGEA